MQQRTTKSVCFLLQATTACTSNNEAQTVMLQLQATQQKDEYDKVIKVKRVRTTALKNNEYDIDVTLQVPLKHYIGQTMSELQEYIADCIEKYGGIMVHQVSIEIEEWG